MQPERRLQQVEEIGQRGDLLGDRHLGKGDHEAFRQAPSGLADQRGQEEVERAEGPRLQLLGERLDADADEGRQAPGREPGGHLAGGGLGVAVLLRVRTVAVAILEVGPEVLDRLAAEPLGDTGVNRDAEVLPQPHRRREVRGSGGVLFESPQRQRSQPGGDVGLEEVRAAVDRVDRLAASGIARLGPGKFEVRATQALEDGTDGLVAQGHPAIPITIRRTTRSRAKRR